MENIEKIAEKRMYNSPEIELIKLDNEISLALESYPPVGPDESKNYAPEYFDNFSFKENIT
jgi:hypothetical protein